MTKYIDLRENKTPLEGVTSFEKLLTKDLNALDSGCPANEYQNVALICIDKSYGAIFKAWDGVNDSSCFIYFGHAGEEFNAK